MYNLPILSQLILLLHWILVTINDWLASLGLGPEWTWGLAIIGLTVIVRLILFPLTWKQFSSAQSMQAIQPKIKELQKKYKNDRGKLQQETMKLYQEHRVNPFASCLPLLLQLPVFIGLYAAIKGLGPAGARRSTRPRSRRSTRPRSCGSRTSACRTRTTSCSSSTWCRSSSPPSSCWPRRPTSRSA